MQNEYLVIVSCGKNKAWDRRPEAGPLPACEAYTSPAFKASRRYAEYFAREHWLILSAKYGLIEPGFPIPGNYNVKFGDAGAVSPAVLRAQVAKNRFAALKTVGVLGPEAYWLRVTDAFAGSAVVLRHLNGNVSFAPSFINLIDRLIAKDTPFRENLEK